MSEFKLNIIDRDRAISGLVHDHLGPAVLAALTAEPENIAELENALRRFLIWEVDSPLAGLTDGEDLTEAEDGLLAIDLASRTVYVEELGPDDPDKFPHVWIETPVGEEDGFYLPFLLSGDWLQLDSLEEFQNRRRSRLVERDAHPPIDYRAVMYGAPMVEFIAQECAAIPRTDPPPESMETDPAVAVHRKWYMTPREDLGGKTPREVLFHKRRFIERDLEWRERQWSFAGVCPPHIDPNTNAYRYSGFGIHEWVIYYYLFRHLVDRAIYDEERSSDLKREISRLSELRETFWNTPDPESFGRTPRAIVESERRRIGLSMSAKEMVVDEDCPCCQAMAEDFSTPGFWHLDGCNMDDCFEFSYSETREEYEKEQAEWAIRDAEIKAEIERKDRELGPGWFQLEMDENYRQAMAEYGGGELVDDGQDSVDDDGGVPF